MSIKVASLSFEFVESIVSRPVATAESSRSRPRAGGWLAVLLAASAVMTCGSAEAQQAGKEYRYLRHARSYLQLNTRCGRIRVIALKTTTFSPRATDAAGRKEQVTVSYDQARGVLRFRYHLATGEEKLSVTAESDGRVSLRREPVGGSDVVPSHFVQEPSGPLTLWFGAGDARREFSAPTLWHLLLAQPDACARHVIPYLQIVRPDWRLAEQALAVRRALLAAAQRGKLPDQSDWAKWVAQLGDEQYARRETADARLRKLGPVVVPYLQGLRRDRLDAEQQFRIHRIIRALTSSRTDETPEQAADAMLIDPTIWLVLMEHGSLETRRAAATYLGRLLDEPIEYDPTADAAKRREQIAAIRAAVVDAER